MTPAPALKHTIWALHCPFDKHGSPVMGLTGRSIEGVVVMRASTWTALCKEHPTLGATEFNVGMHDDESRTPTKETR